VSEAASPNRCCSHAVLVSLHLAGLRRALARMKLRTTLALLAFAAALAGAIFGLDRCSQSTRERQERAAHIGRVNRKDIRGFTIQNGEETIRLKADGDDWKMLAPWKDDADISVIDQLLDAAAALHSDDIIADLGRGEKKREMLKDFGLNKPRLRLRVEGKKMPGEFQFGHDSAVRGECYLRVGDDDAVYVVGNDLKNLVSKKAEDYRDHRMTPFLTTLINRAIFRVNGGEIELSREQDNWLLQRPIKARASNDAVEELLTKINQTQIARFISDEKGSTPIFGIDPPLKAVTLFGGENAKAEIIVGNSVQSDPHLIYARLPERNSVVEVPKEFAALFDITPNDLRDRKIARLNADLIDRVTIEKTDQPKLIFGRQENRWRFLNSSQSLANARTISGLIQTLNQGEVVTFVSDTASDLSKYGLDRQKLKITFSSFSSENTAETNAGETVLATLAFGNSAGGVTFARIEQEPYVFSVSDQFVNELPTAEISFRTLDILELRRDELESVHIEKPGQEPTDLVRDNKGKWVLRDHPLQQDEGKVQSFLNTLASLRAATWLGNSTKQQGANPPSLLVKIRYRSGETDREVELKFENSNSENQHYGTSTEQTGTFLLDDVQFKRLDAALTR
jgi:uncharacterized protein DUF4340